MFDLLKKWLSGNINASSERKLDESAKKDSFLADALEGYRSMPEADHAASVEELKARLNKKSKRKGSIIWQRIAAAAAVLFAVGLIYLINSPKSEAPMASNEPTEPVTEEQIVEIGETSSEGVVTLTDSLEAPTSVPPNAFPIIADETKGAMVTTEQAQKDPSENRAPGIVPTPIETTDVVAGEIERSTPVEILDEPISVIELDTLKDVIVTTPAIEPSVVDTVKPEQPIENADLEPYVYRDEKETRENKETRELRGIIRDEDTGEQLIGANILIEGTTIGTVTDFDGAFTLVANEPLPWSLVIAYIGYESQQVEVSTVDQLVEVNLSEGGVALSEVVVSSQGRRPRKAKKKKAQAKPDEPQPKKGFKKFKRYLKNETRYPEAARENGVEGRVMLSFYINSSGRPENISIISSLGYGLDEEAIRLLENGPDWAPVDRTATYELEFSL